MTNPTPGASPLDLVPGADLEYFRKLADFLKKDLGSESPARQAGALARITRTRPQLKGHSPREVLGLARLGDCLDTIATEMGLGSWRDLAALFGETGSVPGPPGAPDDGRMKRFRFSFGNSSVGPVGAVLEVLAVSVEEAVRKARAAIPESVDNLEDRLYADAEGLWVYFNEMAITAEDIEEWEFLGGDDGGNGGIGDGSVPTDSGPDAPARVTLYEDAEGLWAYFNEKAIAAEDIEEWEFLGGNDGRNGDIGGGSVPTDSGPDVPARITTDDGRLEAEFDARAYLASATEGEIEELDAHGYRGCYAADNAAGAAQEQYPSIRKIFDYLSILNEADPGGDGCGFEVYIDSGRALEWLRTHRRYLWLTCTVRGQSEVRELALRRVADELGTLAVDECQVVAGPNGPMVVREHPSGEQDHYHVEVARDGSAVTLVPAHRP